MITISNSQRDYVVKYIDLMCEALKSNDLRTSNTKRMAMNLKKQLEAKQPLSVEDLSHLQKLISKKK